MHERLSEIYKMVNRKEYNDNNYGYFALINRLFYVEYLLFNKLTIVNILMEANELSL